jgi:hypothetical protein
MNYLTRVAASAVAILFGVSHVSAQETCLLYQRGTVECPGYGAPAATAVPGPSMDGGVPTIPNSSSTTLFSGRVPPNGFMVRVFTSVYGLNIPGIVCFVNDSGPANLGAGFYLKPDEAEEGAPASATFSSPPGYKPIGPVSIWCTGGQNSAYSTVYLSSRGW